MKSIGAFVSLALMVCAGILAQNFSSKAGNENSTQITRKQTVAAETPVASNEVGAAVEKGAKWLASVQGADGGWGQDGGESPHIRQNVSLESQGNDVANTAVAALALLRAGNQYRPKVERAINFILKKIEASPAEGLSITDVNQTQIQRKLGPYIDTFLASILLAKVDGTLAASDNARVRGGLEKCVSKIERNQLSDGSWNVSGGWAPVLGTSLASQSLYMASNKGVAVSKATMAKAEDYTLKSQKYQAEAGGALTSFGGASTATSLPIAGRSSGALAELKPGTAATPAPASAPALSAAAGVVLYQDAQALEQLSRTAEDRAKNGREITAIKNKLSSASFVDGYGSIGGEEFFSYLNINDSLKRTGGKEWSDWHSKITQKILKLQNNDGTWAGHHCITGRVAVTSAAILNLMPEHAN
jgi:Squalene-hopene cyclase C-terminal domain/Prenyltransferase and squalene oxidase repeat